MNFLYEALGGEGAVLTAGLQIDTSERAVIRGILFMAREKAVAAARELFKVDPHDWQAIQDYQNDIRRYSDLIVFVRTIKDTAKEIYDGLPDQQKAVVEDEWFPPLEGDLNDN